MRDRRTKVEDRSTEEERRRSDWRSYWRPICERGIALGRTDTEIMDGVLEVNRARCRELLAIVRAEHESKVRVA